MELFQKILCPIDYDGQCRASLDLARKIAEVTSARVYALHVALTEPAEDVGREKGVTLRPKKIADEHLNGVEHEFVVRIGLPAVEVLDAARDLGADLILIPTHGREGLKRLVLGSVAEHIIRESNIPVLTVRKS
ncbi:MAG: universal stress protein [Deltaproteobacteria bacterium]|nr:universal stress protein [Deltaproteobacteria bacterium]